MNALGLLATIVMLVFLDPTAWVVGLGLMGVSPVVWVGVRPRAGAGLRVGLPVDPGHALADEHTRSATETS